MNISFFFTDGRMYRTAKISTYEALMHELSLHCAHIEMTWDGKSLSGLTDVRSSRQAGILQKEAFKTLFEAIK